MKIVKTTIGKVSSIEAAITFFDRFLSHYQGKIVQISGPHITLTEGRSSLPDYIISGSIIVEDGEKAITLDDKLTVTDCVDYKLITGVNTTGVNLNG